jgi:ferredoxin
MDDITSELDSGLASGLEPELGGSLREHDVDRSGLEPELGGSLRQNAVYVDEGVCIGCKHCAHVARNTFFIEDNYGRSRVFSQDGDAEEVVQEAIDTCPVDCIAWVSYNDLIELESARQHQVIQNSGIAGDSRSARVKQNRRKRNQANISSKDIAASQPD